MIHFLLTLHRTRIVPLLMDSEEKKRFRLGESSCMDSLRLVVLAVAVGLTLWRTCDCVNKYLQFRRESEVNLFNSGFHVLSSRSC